MLISLKKKLKVKEMYKYIQQINYKINITISLMLIIKNTVSWDTQLASKPTCKPYVCPDPHPLV